MNELSGLDQGAAPPKGKKKIAKKVAVKKTAPGREGKDPQKVLAAVLAPFKLADRAEVVVFVDDANARRIAVGWLTFRVVFEIPADPLPIEKDSKGNGIPTSELWEWAWKGVPNIRWKGFIEKLADHCGVDRACVKGIFDVLKANRVIYPDNSISSWASKGIGHEVARRYQGSRRLT